MACLKCPEWPNCCKEGRNGARGGPSDDLRAGTPLLGGKAGRAGAGQPGEGKAAGRPESSCQYLKGAYKKDEDKHFSSTCCDRARGNGFELREGRFRLGRRKKFSTLRVARPWPRLPREAVAAPSLAASKARLAGAWRTLGWWKGSLPTAGGWNQMICKVPSNPTHSMVL